MHGNSKNVITTFVHLNQSCITVNSIAKSEITELWVANAA
jgi:hypothetical protein